jgi:HIV Tat-specific factor 1
MFNTNDFSGPGGESFGEELEGDVAGECEKCGAIEKITVFSKNPRGVVVVKFATSYGAQECVKLMNGRFFGGRKIQCIFWDGVTNYSVLHSAAAAKEEEAAERLEASRLGEFGDWLEQEQEELPEEFKLRTEK